MTATATSARLGCRIAIHNHAVPLLQAFALTTMVFPSSQVLKAVGGAGTSPPRRLFQFLARVAATLLACIIRLITETRSGSRWRAGGGPRRLPTRSSTGRRSPPPR